MGKINYPLDKIDLTRFFWINQPNYFRLKNNRLTVITDPGTDFWQRTYYGFQNDNGHAFVSEINGDFTFSVKTRFKAEYQYDQCGIMLYHNADNWVKASVENENKECARLGSVVTNLGYSDWASTDISAHIHSVSYHFSRKDQDFLIEYSFDDVHFTQMRIFHIDVELPLARIGVYACSPLNSSFKAEFSDFKLGACQWQNHQTE
jgi:regulation of enolase protein 1 (concanavalin A-like superfamily)